MAWGQHDAPALTVYQKPDERISFGDIFQSKCLIDVHARSDTRALGGAELERTVAQKIAKAMSRELTDSGDRVPMYTPALPQHPENFHVLAHGTTMKLDCPTRAILLTDSCAVDTAMVVDRKGRRKRGRLLFAPVVLADNGEVERLAEQPVFGRFPLSPSDELKQGAVAELRYSFMVDVRDVDGDDRILTLDDGNAEELEVAFTAYALRRGPLATERNIERLANLVASEADPSRLQSLPELMGEVLDLGWRLEASVDDAAASAQLSPERLGRLKADLDALVQAVRLAQECVS